jgi:hypothetical protein
MAKQSSRIRAETRLFHAQMMAAVSGSLDGRLARIFELVPREAFLGPGPWQICVPSGNGRSHRRYIQTPSADPVHINQNVLVALDAQKGIHNGEPYLHAAWIGSANPVGGEIVSLAMLVTKTREGFSVQPLRPAWFIPCVGASDAGEAQKLPSLPEARSIRSLWLKQDHEPNDTAVAIFGEVWFSSQTISQMAAAA